jgi:hypothetical protein
MRYVEIGRVGSVWGKRTASDVATVSARASRTDDVPTVVVGISVFELDGSHDDIEALVGAAAIDITAEAARRFAERLLKSADEAEERSRRLRYAEEVKEVLS